MPVTITMLSTKKPKTLKDAIISFLAKEWPLSAKKLYNKARKNGFEVSYQAVHKAIKELLNDDILIRDDRAYSLNKDWIDRIKTFASDLGELYEDKSKMTIEKAFEEGYGSFTLTNVYEFYVNMTKILHHITLSSKNDDIGIARVRHLYWALATSNKEYELFTDMMKSYKELYIACISDTKGDRMALEYYKTINEKIHGIFGVKQTESFDLFVVGDFVIQIFFDKATTKIMDLAYKNVHILKGMQKMYGILFRKKVNINIVVMKNPNLAEKFKKDILSHFK